MALPNLRAIFASYRSPLEERQASNAAFYKFLGWTLCCVVISLAASRGRRAALLPNPTR